MSLGPTSLAANIRAFSSNRDTLAHKVYLNGKFVLQCLIFCVLIDLAAYLLV